MGSGKRLLLRGLLRLECSRKTHSGGRDQYRTRAIPLDFDVSTFATVEGADDADDAELFVGVLGATAEPPQFALAKLSSAGEIELLAPIDVEFDYRTAPLPAFGPDVTHHKGNGIPLLGFYDPELPGLSFYHYDGYDLRVLRAQNQGNSWELSEEKHMLHAERTDLSAPGE